MENEHFIVSILSLSQNSLKKSQVLSTVKFISDLSRSEIYPLV